ncbi:HalOD1 output domain-containing protein [Natrinema salifodinae]|uniref:Halobacterial output domain-containing protein n=1 Tax=Natrinema salifodinae TaxID=1202768 RepID=A0A1I0QJI7_9EURY|nr:HalOD1 output domain-containing protein [Natrinema salifodinae]SEW27301.1 hypothetical protein SAMN05216285_3664 [Natrinema salifodinae]
MTGTTLDYRTDAISLRVIDALADATDTAAHELEPLYRVVDPEALDRLFRDGVPAGVRVEFEYGDSVVEVQSDGTVAVDGTVRDSG